MIDPSVISGATISADGQYRYRLWRIWNPLLPRVAWVMLNPSTADASADDATIRKCCAYARKWGFGGIEVVNLFAIRSTDPKGIVMSEAPIGPDNDRYLRETAELCPMMIAAWGTQFSRHLGRDREVCRILFNARKWVAAGPLHYLKLTKDGHPSHPLYLKGDLLPEPWMVNDGL